MLDIGIYLYAIISVFIVSLISLIGLLIISISKNLDKKIPSFLVALAVGALLGDAFIHLIPEAIENSTNIPLTSLFIILGIFIFFIAEKYIHIHHEHSDCRHIDNEKYKDMRIKPVGKLVLISDGFHNLIDGIIIGIAYLVDIRAGIATTIAVIFHEIPQEIGDFGILLFAGYSKRKAILYNFLSALTSIIGVLIVFLIEESIQPVLLLIFTPLAAGIFIYIAMADLIPELHKKITIKNSAFEIFGILLGVFSMYALLFLE